MCLLLQFCCMWCKTMFFNRQCITLLMTLIGVKVGKIENGVEKIREILVRKGVWLEWFGEEKMLGSVVFSLGLPLFSPPNCRENGEEKTLVGSPIFSSSFFFFFYFFFYGLFIKFFTCLFYSKIIFFFIYKIFV